MPIFNDNIFLKNLLSFINMGIKKGFPFWKTSYYMMYMFLYPIGQLGVFSRSLPEKW